MQLPPLIGQQKGVPYGINMIVDGIKGSISIIIPVLIVILPPGKSMLKPEAGVIKRYDHRIGNDRILPAKIVLLAQLCIEFPVPVTGIH